MSKSKKLFTVRLIPNNQPYEPELIKPLVQPDGSPDIICHYNKEGALIGIQTTVLPEVFPPGIPPDSTETSSAKIPKGSKLFPPFKDLLRFLKE